MVEKVTWHHQMPTRMDADAGLIAIGIVVVLAVLIAAIIQYVEVFKDWKVKDIFLIQYLKFAYASFLKPHTGKADGGQQSALESFYSTQASIYDATRKRLLNGREDMLGLVAAQLQLSNRRPADNRKPIWFDVGGGTGYNIEVMDKIVGVDGFFEHVYLIDLSPSLCEIAQQRVKRFGWKNVSILCQDARTIQTYGQTADLITMSYSLSMIPDFYGVVDLLTGVLTPQGVIGICDFYVQSIVDVTSRNYTGGTINRHVNWLGRMFWRTWFDADRVNLDAGRRDYVEYRFGTILSASERNYLLGGIPYYLFIGCRREAETARVQSRESLELFDAAITESPYLSGKEYRQKFSREASNNIPRSKSYESAIVNLTSNLPLPAAFYQSHHWRIYYNDLLPKHQQFKQEYIYAFNWEDPAVDRELLNITKDDVLLTITSAGDNILDYLLETPKRVHAVDLNPNQNHLLELKCAAFTALGHSECWSLFADGTHPDFRDLLLQKLSPHMSSHAFQFWLNHADTFSPHSKGLYSTGGSRHALNLIRWLFKLFNLTRRVRTMCTVETLNEQREIWSGFVRDVLLSWPLHSILVSTEWWSWKAAGVPKEQRDLILNDYFDTTNNLSLKQESRKLSVGQSNRGSSGEAIWQYITATLDPVVETTQISRDNYFYYLCLQGKYSKKCHPRYLSVKSHARLSKPSAFDGLRIHTDEIMEVISRMSDESLTIAVLMDSMDWFTPPPPKAVHFEQKVKRSQSKSRSTEGEKAALNQVVALHRVLKTGTGRILFRSAALYPWYVDIFEQNGFKVKCVARRDHGKCIDRVNMYASTWLCRKVSGTTPPSSPKSVLVNGPGSPRSALAARARTNSLASVTSSEGRGRRLEKVNTAGSLDEMMLPGAAMEVEE